MLSQNWACAMVVSLGVRIDFPPNFMMGLLLLFPKKEEEFQLNLAGRWDSGRTHPSPPHRNWHKLGTSLLFKTEGVVGGREVVLLGSSMQAFGLVSVSLQSPSFLLLTDPKWFRITGHSRTFFFFSQAEYYQKCKHSKLSHSSLVAENPIVRSCFESSEGGAGRGARPIMATKF